MIIRNAKITDAARMNEIEKQCFSLPWTEEMIISEMGNNFSYYLLAEEGEELLGYVGVNIICGVGYISNLAVNNKHRRRGIAKALLKALMNLNADEFTLEVRVSNDSARSLYESFGFKIVGTRKEYYENPAEDAYIMSVLKKHQ